MELWGGTGTRAEARVLLACLLSARFGLDPMPQPDRGPAGKPWFPARPDVHFNVSHSGGLLLCGAGTAPVGVDIERVRPRRDGLARYVLSEAEYAWFQARGARWEDLYGLWTLKEARCKCTGGGLDRPPRRIAVPLLGPGEAGTLDGLRFRSYGGEGWRAAACAAAPEEPPAEIRWPPRENVLFS